MWPYRSAESKLQGLQGNSEMRVLHSKANCLTNRSCAEMYGDELEITATLSGTNPDVRPDRSRLQSTRPTVTGCFGS